MSKALTRYSFINAKLKTRMDFLLKENFYKKLEDRPNLNEAMLMLKPSSYGLMEKIYEQTGDLKMAEKELREKEIGFYKELKRHTDELLSGFLDVLLVKYDIEILKDWIRLWFDSRIRKRDISALTPYMIRMKVITPLDPDALMACGSEEELYAFISTYDLYRDVFEQYREQKKALNNLYDLERDLDRLRFQKIREAAANFPDKDKEIILKLTGMEIDFENMLHLLRMIPLMPLEQILEDMIPGGRSSAGELGRGKLSEKSILEKSLSPYGSMGTLLLRDEGNPRQKMEMIEAVFDEIKTRETAKILRRDPFTIGIMLIYFIRKSGECRRLVSILNKVQYKSQIMGTGGLT
ncbi:MAG: V-type ATPase subunit [Spirochaetales bacterium]|nr:V-type ATPase subunit [Spirochaetales bacterium]